MFEELLRLSRRFLTIKNSSYKRYLVCTESFKDNRLSLIVGQRGVGKTTALVQSLVDWANGDILSTKILYIQADHFQVGNNSLYEIAEEFVNMGGEWIAFDEIHKYPNWAQELKSIYDTFPELCVLASGSSALEIYQKSHDLSRRAIQYYMYGMSFREYLEMTYQIKFFSYQFEEICRNHEVISTKIISDLKKRDLKILPLFHQYFKVGYYPYFKELNNNENLYQLTLEQNAHTTIESDLAAIYPELTGNSIKKIKQLLVFIAQSVPFIPTWNKIVETLEIGDVRTLKTYFKHLEDAGLVRAVARATKKLKKLELPEKVYLNNTNQLFAMSPAENVNKGTLREVFFLCMLSKDHRVTLSKSADFLVDDQFFFEIGGRKKTFQQLAGTENGYLACDNIEHGVKRKIPLWLFGFLY